MAKKPPKSDAEKAQIKAQWLAKREARTLRRNSRQGFLDRLARERKFPAELS